MKPLSSGVLILPRDWLTQRSGILEDYGVPTGRPLPEYRARNWLAIASLVLGILGLLTWLAATGLGSMLLGLAAAITGFTASNQITRSRDAQRGQTAAVAGLALGLASLILGIVVLGAFGIEPGFLALPEALGF